MRNDFDRIDDGQVVKVFPDPATNLLAKEPYEVIRYDNGFYPVKGESAKRIGPDYSLSNIARYCLGYEEVENGPPFRDTKE
jgi:hypothetical protein